MHTVHPVPIYEDNYVWVLIQGQQGVIVDPGDAAPVKQWLAKQHITPVAIIITHGHWDHVTGVASLVADFNIPVYGPAGANIPCMSHPVEQDDTFDLLETPFKVLRTPGHTADHICYYLPKLQSVFCGDVLFSAGCGRVNQSMSNAHASIQKLVSLPPETKVYCTHEYTLANIEFALAVEPNNEKLVRYKTECEQTRRHQKPTLPTTIGLECDINPFVRTSKKTIVDKLTKRFNTQYHSDSEVFTALREWKNHF